MRTELPTLLTNPWEITVAPDGYLWVTELLGQVSRVNPDTGDKQIAYLAPDFFGGDPSEQWPFCTNPNIGSGTLGLALHPQFSNPDSSFIYYTYSYNSNTLLAPKTKFKIVRLKWNPVSQTVTDTTDLVLNLPNGYDHFGGRLISTTMDGKNYLFHSIGDLGKSEINSPDCYTDQADNPNNFTQHIDSMNGKIHRYNMDGSIPADNPVAGKSFYTRGHRNPQGLAFNATFGFVYSIEHGDRTDDEVNVLESGMNYGWKDVRGYQNDDNYSGEMAYANSYIPNPLIANDHLVDPIHSWCTDTMLNGTGFLNWCTVAPSDGEHYTFDAIHQWTNSLLVVTLKEGLYTNREVHVLHLSEDGKTVLSTETFFGEDQALNGRLRDIAISLDGKKIYLINNAGTDRDKITVYTYDISAELNGEDLLVFPNPSTGNFVLLASEDLTLLSVYDSNGKLILEIDQSDLTNSKDVVKFSLSDQAAGVYTVKTKNESGSEHYQKIVKI